MIGDRNFSLKHPLPSNGASIIVALTVSGNEQIGWPGSKSINKIFGNLLMFLFIRYVINDDFPTFFPPIVIILDTAVSCKYKKLETFYFLYQQKTL